MDNSWISHGSPVGCQHCVQETGPSRTHVIIITCSDSSWQGRARQGQQKRLHQASSGGAPARERLDLAGTSLEKREGVRGVVGGKRGQEDAGASPSRAHATGSKAGLPASSGWI